MQSWLISGGHKLAAWLRSRSGAAPTLMETEAVTVDEGRGRSAWDEAPRADAACAPLPKA